MLTKIKQMNIIDSIDIKITPRRTLIWLLLLLCLSTKASACWEKDLLRRIEYAQNSTEQVHLNFLEFIKKDENYRAKYQLLYNAGGIELIDTKGVHVLDNFYGDYGRDMERWMTFFEEHPEAKDAWVLLKEEGINISKRQDQTILQNVIENNEDIEIFGGYQNWMDDMEAWRELETPNSTYYNSTQLGELYKRGDHVKVYHILNKANKRIHILTTNEIENTIIHLKLLKSLKAEGIPTAEIYEITTYKGMLEVTLVEPL